MYEKSVGQISIITKQDVLGMSWSKPWQSFIEICRLENWYSDFQIFHDNYFGKYQIRNFHREIDTSINPKSPYSILRTILFHMKPSPSTFIKIWWLQSCAQISALQDFGGFSRFQLQNIVFRNFKLPKWNIKQWDQSDHPSLFVGGDQGLQYPGW